jgi:hypothetical protein
VSRPPSCERYVHVAQILFPGAAARHEARIAPNETLTAKIRGACRLELKRPSFDAVPRRRASSARPCSLSPVRNRGREMSVRLADTKDLDETAYAFRSQR